VGLAAALSAGLGGAAWSAWWVCVRRGMGGIETARRGASGRAVGARSAAGMIRRMV